ncbi:MAG: CHASE2 domain-containing protein [Candidatus Obscuribacterales bacterium]|nr:CHASE2 domain-containing protein [Candidatus Obscuribacterales bacterium]
MKRLGLSIETDQRDANQRLLFLRLFFGALLGCLVSLFCNGSPLLETMEMSMFEWRYKIAESLNRESPTKAAQSICLVAFDDASQFDIGVARFNEQKAQDRLAELINKIEERGDPLLIIVDLDLRGATSPELVSTLSRHHNVVLSLFGSLEGSTDLPAADLLNHCVAYGYHELIKEAGGMVLRLPDDSAVSLPNEISSTELVPSLTRAALNAYGRISGVDYVSKMTAQHKDQLAYINYHDLSYPLYSMGDVLETQFNDALFKDKIVLIGSTLTPRKQDPARAKSPFHKEQPEIFMHAHALSTVMNNEIIWNCPPEYAKQVLVVIGALAGALSSILPLGRRTLFAGGFSLLLVVLSQFAFQSMHLALPLVTPLVTVLAGFVLGTVIYLDSDLREKNKELAATRKMMQVRAEDERKRIAEDLHDETLPALSSIARMVDKLPDTDPEPRIVREKLDETIQEMRRVINDLHPSVLETMGFFPALENLVRIIEREMPIEGIFQTAAEVQESHVPEFAKLQLYRMVQESLNNVRKHSQANKVSVQVLRNGSLLKILVVDNGCGIDPKAVKPEAHGLLNIRHRAALIGAQVSWRRPKLYKSGTEFSITMELETYIEKEGV